MPARTPRLRLIVNPTAGGGRGAGRAEQAGREFARLGRAYEVHSSRSPDEPGALARQAVADGCSVVVAVGGDGLVSAVANGLVDTPVRLGIVPAGRGNDFARGLGLPLSVSEACRVVASGESRRVDVGQADDRYFLSVAQIGLTAEINRRANRLRRIRLPAVYSLVTVASVFLSAPQRFTVVCDGRTRRSYSWLVAVGNTWSAARGMRLVPGARADDGMLDACLAHGMGRWELLLCAFPRVFRGTHVYASGVERLRGKEMRVDADEPADVYADGERIGRLPVTLRAVPRALSVILPAARC